MATKTDTKPKERVELLRMRDGSEIDISSVESEYLKRQFRKLAKHGDNCTVVVAEGDAMAILKKLAALSSQKQNLLNIRKYNPSVRDAIKLSDLSCFDDVIDQLFAPVNRAVKKYQSLWNTMERIKKQKKKAAAKEKPAKKESVKVEEAEVELTKLT